MDKARFGRQRASHSDEPGFLWGEVSYHLLQADGAMARNSYISGSLDIRDVILELNRSVPSMANLVRPAHIDAERAALTAFLSTYLSPDATDERYEWLYLKNPAGIARVWVACDSESKEIIGVASAFPRLFYRSGKQAFGYVLGDFCIDLKHRSLGPALALQRISLETLLGSEADFVYDFPSATMLAVYRRLHIKPQEQTVRFAKLLCANRRVEAKLQIHGIERSLAAVANMGLKMLDLPLRRSGGSAIQVETSPCGEEFTQAALKWSHDVEVCVARTAEYLNWRYKEHPQRRYEMLTARNSKRLCGYLVHHREGENSAIDDLVGDNDSVRRDLVIEAITMARKQQVQTLSAPWLSAHRGRRLLESCGFRPRESSPVVLMTSVQTKHRTANESIPSWYLTNGDRES